MTSPMKNPAQHDRFALLDGSKELVLPGIASVTAGLRANTDTMEVPGEGNQQAELNPATGEVEVRLWMHEAEQWEQYQSILGRLRQGDGKGGPAQFTCAHPEVRSRRIKKLYFQSEDAQPYNPRDGYRVTLKFSESLKKAASSATLNGQGNGSDWNPGGTDAPAGTGGGTPTEQGNRVYQAAMGHLPPDRPAPADGGRANTGVPGYCSAFARVVGTRAGMSASLFGASAKQTEANFRSAGISRPWTGPQNLQKGDFVFWANDPSGYGHVGVVVGFAADGMPLIANNSSINKPEGRAINRLNQLSTSRSQPTSYGRAGGFSAPAAPRKAGPVAPVR